MGKRLIVAEKPSVGRDIAHVLNCKNNKNGYIVGNNDIVTWAVGHLVRLLLPPEINPKFAVWNLDDLPIIPKPFLLGPIDNTKKQFELVKELMNGINPVYIIYRDKDSVNKIKQAYSEKCLKHSVANSSSELRKEKLVENNNINKNDNKTASLINSLKKEGFIVKSFKSPDMFFVDYKENSARKLNEICNQYNYREKFVSDHNKNGETQKGWLLTKENKE